MAHIEIENLTFSYPSAGRPSLSNVSLTIRRGEYVVLCGKSGSGKTTLVSLITRLYDVNVGEVKIFGHNVKDYSSDELYSLFGVAPQKAVLFEGTVRDNIRWGKEDATDEEIEKALVEYARLKKDIVTIGVYDKVEIWSAEEWNSRRKTKSAKIG